MNAHIIYGAHGRVLRGKNKKVENSNYKIRLQRLILKCENEVLFVAYPGPAIVTT